MSKDGDKEADKDFDAALKQVGENPKYKVLTKEEYEILMGGAIPKTSTPRATLSVKPPTAPFTPRTPGAAPFRMQQLLDKMKDPTGKGTNLSTIDQSFAYSPSSNFPKLPIFSGAEEPSKGEVSYEVRQYEVKCLQKSLPEHVLLLSIRTSLRGAARDMLIPLGEDATVEDILDKLDGFYGNVSSPEAIIQSFYSDAQRGGECVATFGSRLEQTLSRAIRYGHMELAAKDSMLRSKFWTGLRSQQLRNSTRYLYDTYKKFPDLLREIRKVEQEESCSTPTPPTKQKVAQQLFSQVSTEQPASDDKIQKQISELVTCMKSLEKKLDSQQQSFAAAAEFQSSYQDYDYNSNQRGRGRGYNQQVDYDNNQRGRGRGYKKPWRGNRGGYAGRGNSEFQSGNSDYQNNNRGSYKGGRSRGRGHGGANGRGANRGGGSQRSDNSLN